MIETQTVSKVYDIGSLTQFAIPFDLDGDSELLVFVLKTEDNSITALSDTDYSVSGATLEVSADLSAYTKIALLRSTPISQEVLLSNGKPINALTLMEMIDRLAYEVQENRAKANRSLLFSLFDQIEDLELPVAAERQRSLLGFGEDGKTFVMTRLADLEALENATETAASAAQASASAAATSAGAAATSESNAAASAESSAASAGSASDSAASAQTSEINSLANKNAAATSATNAATDATTAATKAAEASDSATAASASETNAKESETNAAASEDSALASKNAAATSETNAGISETNAEASKDSALDSKNAAATSATNAATSATAAASFASNAAASEENAAASATAAATSETNAADSATQAAASAAAAETEAQTFAATTSTNPYTGGLTPRRIGDYAVNTTSLEIWQSVATAGATSSWIRICAGTYGGQIVTDATVIAISGWYTALQTATGLPTATESFAFMHINSNAGTTFAFQLFIGYTTGKIYSRKKSAGVWGSFGMGITPAELGYLSGVTSALQTQLDAKLAKADSLTYFTLNGKTYRFSLLSSHITNRAYLKAEEVSA